MNYWGENPLVPPLLSREHLLAPSKAISKTLKELSDNLGITFISVILLHSTVYWSNKPPHKIHKALVSTKLFSVKSRTSTGRALCLGLASKTHHRGTWP